MSNEHHVHVEDDSVEPGDPRQFGVIDLFAFVTLAALVSAMAAQFLREMQAEKRVRLLVVASFQLVVTMGTIAFAVYQRKKLLEKAGWRIGIAYCGEVRWRHWPAVKSVVYMLSLASAQLCLAMMFATEVVELPAPYFLVYEIQLGCISGMAFARFLWRVYPNSMEFFEQGISLRGMTFFPWARIDLRSSQVFADRLVVVLRPAAGSVVGDTRMAQVTDAVRDRVFATASAERER